MDLRANSLNTHTKSEIDNIITPLGISSILDLINNSGTNITNILDTRYTKSEVDNLISNIDLNICSTQTENQTNYIDKNHTTANYYYNTTMGSMISQDSYTKSETDKLLTNKVYNIGA